MVATREHYFPGYCSWWSAVAGGTNWNKINGYEKVGVRGVEGGRVEGGGVEGGGVFWSEGDCEGRGRNEEGGGKGDGERG